MGTETPAPTIQEFRETFGTWRPVAGQWKGDAYNYHPHGVVRRPMIYIDHHNTHGYTDAYVMTDPNAEFYPITSGRDASISSHSQPVTPTPKSGELVLIWTSGHWVGPDGPWRAAMLKHMADIRSEIEEIEQRERTAKDTAEAARKLKADAAYSSAARAFEPR